MALGQPVRPQPLHQEPPKLLRSLFLPLRRDVLGERMDGALEQDTNQQVGVSAAITDQLDTFRHQPNVIRTGRSNSPAWRISSSIAGNVWSGMERA